MSVRVRLTRVGSKKNPIWRVVVADQRSPRDGRFIETIGHYNPQTEPSTIVLDRERFDHWVARGAQPTGTVTQLVRALAKAPPAPPEPAPTAVVETAPEDEAAPAAPEAAAPEAEAAATEPEATAEADADASAAEDEPSA
jgi:small subunit ribosomal protein S16